MNATADNDWHELNYSYLAIAAQQVHQLLERHASPEPSSARNSHRIDPRCDRFYPPYSTCFRTVSNYI
ncbi:MAG TPA: hypothetical protein DCE56_27600 [Cyanobacteria bacterium UBA8553]|nr:hypothetical protein [Cyanobacteria bacterium UBA8553]